MGKGQLFGPPHGCRVVIMKSWSTTSLDMWFQNVQVGWKFMEPGGGHRPGGENEGTEKVG
jgi:hypothetical protein